ncbi:MAG TPA: hypothetical protein VGB83_10515 [Actinomycetota bacterium]
MPPKKSKKAPGAAKFRCPECGFVAKHAMGLGRHRSARHGVVSARQKRLRSAGARPRALQGWVTREQAAAKAGVHYNTVRQWEQAGNIRTRKQVGSRTLLLSLADLDRVLAQRSGLAGLAAASSDASVAVVERKVDALIAGLEQLVASLRGVGAPRRGPGRPKGSGVKRGPGRPKGSGAKKAKRRPGRPKGSGAKRVKRTAAARRPRKAKARGR